MTLEEDVTDFANAIEAAAVNLKHRIAQRHGVTKEETKPTEKPKKEEIQALKSTQKTSSKGPYQLITKAENSGNPVFEMLQNYLKQHNGYAILHDLKIWSFDNPDKIGYRKQ